jgi:hypothetical protein
MRAHTMSRQKEKGKRKEAKAGEQRCLRWPFAFCLLPFTLPRAGYSLLELQAALVVFGVAVLGLCPLVVMQSRQLKKLEDRFSPQTTYYLVPSTDPWAQKLGAAASSAVQDPGASPPPSQTAPVNDVQIVALEKSLTSEEVTAHVSVQVITP